MEDLSLNHTQVGLLMAVVHLMAVLTSVPTGVLVDRIGEKTMIMLGQLFVGFFTVCMAFSTSFFQVLTLRFLAGAGLGMLLPSTNKAILSWFPPTERATAMGIKQIGVNVSGIVCAIILPAISVVRGWRFGFIITGIASFASFFGSLTLYRERDREVRNPVYCQSHPWWTNLRRRVSRDVILVSGGGLAFP